MATNYHQDGTTVHYTNGTGSDIASGAPVVIGALLGVAVTDIADGHSGAVITEGVVELPKATGSAIAQGAAVDFDLSAGAIDGSITPAAGDLLGCGVAWAAAEAADEVVMVKLNAAAATVQGA
jgi:predicted RecA/RadA family phage recombinase